MPKGFQGFQPKDPQSSKPRAKTGFQPGHGAFEGQYSFPKGHTPWNKGKKLGPMSEEQKQAISDTIKGTVSMEKNHGWKGGKSRIQGYNLIYKPNHPHRKNTGYVLEHRLMMEAHLGRYLEPKEHVHHVNGVRDDNRLENLRIVSPSEHTKEHKIWRKSRPMTIEERARLSEKMKAIRKERGKAWHLL